MYILLLLTVKILQFYNESVLVTAFSLLEQNILRSQFQEGEVCFGSRLQCLLSWIPGSRGKVEEAWAVEDTDIYPGSRERKRRSWGSRVALLGGFQCPTSSQTPPPPRPRLRPDPASIKAPPPSRPRLHPGPASWLLATVARSGPVISQKPHLWKLGHWGAIPSVSQMWQCRPTLPAQGGLEDAESEYIEISKKTRNKEEWSVLPVSLLKSTRQAHRSLSGGFQGNSSALTALVHKS